MPKVPCVVAKGLSEKQIKKLRILDNRSADLAEYDIDNLRIELDDLDDMDLEAMFADMDFSMGDYEGEGEDANTS